MENSYSLFLARIDIQHRARHFGREPREDDGCKLENLRKSLVPLLAQLTRLQLAAEAYDSAEPQNNYIDDSLTHWDILADIPAESMPAPIFSPSSAPNNAGVSAPSDTIVPVELQKIALPSNNNVVPGHAHIELLLRQKQAKTHLTHLRELIAEKSFHYSDLIRTAPRKAVVTKARASLKAINMDISFHCQVYSRCRLRLIKLGADELTLKHFRQLQKQDIKASTAILTPNEPGSTVLKLSWIWHDVAHHILPPDADLTDNPATIHECM